MIDAPETPQDVSVDRMPTRVGLDLQERCGIVTLNAPPLNIFDLDLIRDFRTALKAIRQGGAAVVVLRSSAPQAFSSGVDVRIHTPEFAPQMLKRFHDLVRAIDKADAVFIGVVDGVCLGGGLELALSCDFVIASPSSVFGFPEIDLGCFPPVAAALLPRLAPRAAADIVLTGRRFGASEALRQGLLHRIHQDPDAAARDLVAVLLSKSGHALARARRALHLGRRGSVSSAIARIERLYAREIVPSKDAAEGVAAFLEKRPPSWHHQ